MHPTFPPHPALQLTGKPFPKRPSVLDSHTHRAFPKTMGAASIPKAGREEQLRRAATQARRYSSTIRWTEDEQLHMELTDAPLAVLGVSRILRVMTLLVRTKRPVFTMFKTLTGERRRVLTPLGRDFVALLGPSGQEGGIRHEFPEHAFHPLVELFWKHSTTLQPYSGRCPSEPDLLVACVAAIRKEAASKPFRDLRKKHTKSVRQNTESLLDYIDSLFEQWGRLLVIRLDIGHRQVRSGGLHALEPSHKEISRQRRELFKYMRSKRFPATLRGYAWSLEKGRVTSYHQHLLLFFDGSTSWRDVQLARMLGEHWRDVVTRGKGRYYNCNADNYPKRGVGMVQHWDREKLDNLKVYVASYLTKADYLIRTVVAKGKIFSHGRLKRAGAKGGRPRSRRPVWF